jgi:hypothetical protein
MSWDFINVKTVNGRKEYRCEQCRKTIPVGEAHVYVAGKVEGELMAYREHSDCRDACLAHFDHVDHCDDYPFLADDDDRDDEWLLKYWPKVAERLGIVAVP